MDKQNADQPSKEQIRKTKIQVSLVVGFSLLVLIASFVYAFYWGQKQLKNNPEIEAAVLSKLSQVSEDKAFVEIPVSEEISLDDSLGGNLIDGLKISISAFAIYTLDTKEDWDVQSLEGAKYVVTLPRPEFKQLITHEKRTQITTPEITLTNEELSLLRARVLENLSSLLKSQDLSLSPDKKEKCRAAVHEWVARTAFLPREKLQIKFLGEE